MPSLAGLAIYGAAYIAVRVVDNTSAAQIVPILGLWAVGWWWVTGVMVRGAVLTLDGARPSPREFFTSGNALAVVIAGPIYGVTVFVGLALAIVPGLAVIIAALFLLPALVAEHADPFTGAARSARLVWRDLGGCLLLVLALAALVLVWPLLTLAAIIVLGPAGQLVGLGVLVAWPVAAIAVTAAYQVLSRA